MSLKFVRDLLTEDDEGKVWCLVRTSGAASVVTFLGNSIWQAVHATVDLQAFGVGAAALIGAIGTGIGVKARLGGDTMEKK